MVEVLDAAMAEDTSFELNAGEFPPLPGSKAREDAPTTDASTTGATAAPSTTTAGTFTALPLDDHEPFAVVAAASKVADVVDDDETDDAVPIVPTGAAEPGSAAKAKGGAGALRPGASVAFGVRGLADMNAKLMVRERCAATLTRSQLNFFFFLASSPLSLPHIRSVTSCSLGWRRMCRVGWHGR